MERELKIQKTKEKLQHLIGTKIYDWTILEILPLYDKNGKTFVRAKCKCGNIVEVNLSNIKSNYKKDCGCGHDDRMNDLIKEKYNYLIGTQINDWLVLDIIPPENNKHHTSALCECTCGTIKKVNITYLLSEKSKNCGCGRKKKLSDIKGKNLIGQRFGKLVVTELLEERNKFRRRLYRCKCDCGNTCVVSSVCLLNHHTSSCGCILSSNNLYIHNYLIDKNIKHEPEYPVCINGQRFRFDFYLSDYNLFIEYDGEQHYKPVKFAGQSDKDAEIQFDKTKKHDVIKNKYCEDNNINLLRIPYWEKKNIDTIIGNCLQRLNEKGLIEANVA